MRKKRKKMKCLICGCEVHRPKKKEIRELEYQFRDLSRGLRFLIHLDFSYFLKECQEIKKTVHKIMNTQSIGKINIGKKDMKTLHIISDKVDRDIDGLTEKIEEINRFYI